VAARRSRGVSAERAPSADGAGAGEIDKLAADLLKSPNGSPGQGADHRRGGSGMRCPQCQQDNPPHARFCLGCGTRLALTCSACGIELPGGARFCLQCGRAVSGGSSAAARTPAPDAYTPKHLAERILTSKAALEGERKHTSTKRSTSACGRWRALMRSVTHTRWAWRRERIFPQGCGSRVGARHAPPRRPLPRRSREALPAHRETATSLRISQHRDDDVPRDGHDLLAGAGAARS